MFSMGALNFKGKFGSRREMRGEERVKNLSQPPADRKHTHIINGTILNLC